MGDQPMTGKAAGELTIREASLPAKLRDWRRSEHESRRRSVARYALDWEQPGDAGGGLESLESQRRSAGGRKRERLIGVVKPVVEGREGKREKTTPQPG
jgi:hypothetical protein